VLHKGEKIPLDLTSFRTIHIVPELRRFFKNDTLPDLNDSNSLGQLLRLCEKYNITMKTKPTSLTQVVDVIISEVLESMCIQPTFLVGHPLCISPLAKESEMEKV
jgi:lysyl-tRNA synthetase class 2